MSHVALILLGIVVVNLVVYNLHKIRMNHKLSDIEQFWLIIPISFAAVQLLKWYDEILTSFQIGEDLTYYLSFGIFIINFFVLRFLLHSNRKTQTLVDVY